MTAMILAGVAGLLVLYLIVTYNGLVGLRNQVRNGWKQIDVQLKRRHDLIPNLVNTVKGAMEFERETLDRVIQARNSAMAARGVTATAQAEGELSRTLGSLFALSESYPELKSNQNVLQLQEELTSTENKLAFSRQFYNDVVMRFNTATEVFPTVLFARALGFDAAEFFEIEEAARATPMVDLGLK